MTGFCDGSYPDGAVVLLLQPLRVRVTQRQRPDIRVAPIDVGEDASKPQADQGDIGFFQHDFPLHDQLNCDRPAFITKQTHRRAAIVAP